MVVHWIMKNMAILGRSAGKGEVVAEILVVTLGWFNRRGKRDGGGCGPRWRGHLLAGGKGEEKGL